MKNINKPNTVVRVPCTKDLFFKLWLKFLKPLHGLTSREIDVTAGLLKQYCKLSKSINDSALVNNVLFSKSIQEQVREECGVTASHYQVILSKLKRANVVTNNSINPKFVPSIKEEDGVYKLLILFDVSE